MVDDISDESLNSADPPFVYLRVDNAATDLPAVQEGISSDDRYGNPRYDTILIINEGWRNMIQDVGCSKQEIKVKRYKGSNIAPYGPNE